MTIFAGLLLVGWHPAAQAPVLPPPAVAARDVAAAIRVAGGAPNVAAATALLWRRGFVAIVMKQGEDIPGALSAGFIVLALPRDPTLEPRLVDGTFAEGHVTAMDVHSGARHALALTDRALVGRLIAITAAKTRAGGEQGQRALSPPVFLKDDEAASRCVAAQGLQVRSFGPDGALSYRVALRNRCARDVTCVLVGVTGSVPSGKDSVGFRPFAAHFHQVLLQKNAVIEVAATIPVDVEEALDLEHDIQLPFQGQATSSGLSRCWFAEARR